MKYATILICAFCFCINAMCGPGLSEARKLMEQNQPEKAAEILRKTLQQNPTDPWIAYDLAVAEYAAKNYDDADKIWQELASTTLPKKLQGKVWTQIGNVFFRKGEPLEQSAPEQALPFYEQSREAYKVALATQPKDTLTKHNLKVVEQKLAKLHSLLARKLLNEINNRSLKETIEKLEAALDHQRTAKELDPQNQQYANDVKQTESQLSSKLTERARQQEQRADSTVNNPSAGKWEREQAIKNLENALTDYREASNLNEQNQEAKNGEQRVLEKLSSLLTREAQRLHTEAKQESSWNQQDAISKYEQAIDKYDEALQLNENNQTAQTGREQAKQELENLLMKYGDKLANEGRQEKERNPADAAEKMMNALNNYENALELNPNNTEAPPKIEALEKELPPLLMALGEREQQRAALEEQKSPQTAVAHLEKAATSYDMIQQIEQNNELAKQRAEQVRNDIARLRNKLAQMAQQKAQQEQNKNQYTRDFNTLLGWAKNDDKQKQYEEARRSPTTKYTPQNEKIYKNW
ncbi:MAG: tetratricopeptide repeat protein [Verrucomicrobiia bacterium]